ncbi:MAG TPA: type IX secretion system membrane protein PorP/SprF [bacterium]|nr:type IX secretion system membrane protein PorP/SprF [bacterium]HPG45250.1 type IX secretion system membrane protein PorP/SprF [bacterium]HPM99031.1 type IX secretion system membrane protein PorP/SprF [bacterium]
MKRYIFILLFLTVVVVHGQSFLPLNSSYPDGYLLGFYNPAPLALEGHMRATVGMQFLNPGLSGDALRNQYISAMMPLGERSALGLRTQYFTSDVLQNLQLSLQASHLLFRGKLAFGISASMLHHSFNKDKFFLFDMNDPVIANGTSVSVFSIGGGLYFQPFDGFHMGLAADHLNEPDVSLNESGICQRTVYHAGLTYSGLPLVPQFEVRMEDEALLTQMGAHLCLLDQRLRLFAGYNRYSHEGSNLLVEGELRIGNLGFVYGFQHPLLTDFAHLSSGSHQIGIVFAGGGETGSIPTVNLENLSSRLQIPQAWLKGKASNRDGLRKIEMRINDRLWKTLSGSDLKNAKTFDVSETIPLELGRNIIQVTAQGRDVSASDKVFTLFEPEAPHVQIRSIKNVQSRERDYALHFSVQDPNDIKRVRIYLGTDQIEDITRFPDPKSADITRPVVLAEGKNRIKIVAENAWLSAADSAWIDLRPFEPVPSLVIDSPDLPISPSSQIIINLDLENAENIKEVIIKVNGTIVDTARVRRTRLFGIADVVGYDSTVVVNLTSQKKNLIEAIALDDEGLPRISQKLDVYYNPYAREMRYSRKKAYIIGINNYKNSTIPDLVDAIPDAKSVAAVLDSVHHFDQIQLLLDEQANFESLYSLFSDTLARAKPGEFIVIFFSGHGDKLAPSTRDPLGFLLPWDAELDSYSKRITMDFINGYLRSTEAADVLCIFDACFSGAAIVTPPQVTYELLPTEVGYDRLRIERKKKALNLLTAASRHEPAVDGLFTRLLVRGLCGSADHNDDGYITSTELGLYTRKFVTDEARNRYRREQNPQFGGLFSEFGECVFERGR